MENFIFCASKLVMFGTKISMMARVTIKVHFHENIFFTEYFQVTASNFLIQYLKLYKLNICFFDHTQTMFLYF